MGRYCTIDMDCGNGVRSSRIVESAGQAKALGFEGNEDIRTGVVLRAVDYTCSHILVADVALGYERLEWSLV